MGQESLNYIREQLYSGGKNQSKKVSLGFPTDSPHLDEPLGYIIKVWKSVEPTPLSV